MNEPLNTVDITFPENWKLDNLKNITKINQGLQIAISERFLEKVEGSYFYLTNEFLRSGSKKKFYILNPSKSVLCNEDDILMTRTGNTGQVVTGVNGAFHNNFFKIKWDKTILDKGFLYYFLTSYQTQRLILKYAGTSTIPDLNHSDFYRIEILLPPLKEQQKIAQILSQWDEAIETTQNLITQLQLRKKGLMQELLSGKKRLAGFSDEWVEKSLDELFIPIQAINDGGDHEPLSISAGKGFISQKQKFDRIIAGTSLKKYTQLKKGDFAYNKGNSKSYKMGCIYLLENFETALVPFVFISFRPTDKVFSSFFKYFFINHGLDRQLKKIITSGARGDGLLNVSKKDFFKLNIPFPKLKEQKAIGLILEVVDEEINTSSQHLESLKHQKKGLMQQLLTGQKRVKF